MLTRRVARTRKPVVALMPVHTICLAIDSKGHGIAASNNLPEMPVAVHNESAVDTYGKSV